MPNSNKVDICILGAGAAGLSVSATAVQIGARVVLIEAEKMGGDCLNYGCVPSKALLAAAKKVHVRDKTDQDMNEAMKYVQGVIDQLAPNDSVERFEKLGVEVIKANAFFKNKNTVQAGDHIIQARRFVIATGSSPLIPNIPGINAIPYYTNETIFQLTEKPAHLIIIGGGPISCELAQAFLWLGIPVTVLEKQTILSKDEPDLVNIIRQQFENQGLRLHEGVEVTAFNKQDNGVELSFKKNGVERSLHGSHVLIAIGRKVNVEHLNLSMAEVDFTPKGIKVNKRLQTTNKHIYAMGDVIGSYQFTHMASYHAGIVIRNILFRLPTQVNDTAVPWVTYTDPELAHVGLMESAARQQDPKIKILTWDFKDNDRAQIENEIVGKIKVITSKRGVTLGASILGAHAGELLLPWIALISEKKKIRNMASLVVPYPTRSEISKRVAAEYYTPILFSKRTRWLVRLLALFG